MAERAGEGFQQVKKPDPFLVQSQKHSLTRAKRAGGSRQLKGKNEHFNVVFRLHFKTHKIIHKAHKILCIFTVEKNGYDYVVQKTDMPLFWCSFLLH